MSILNTPNEHEVYKKKYIQLFASIYDSYESVLQCLLLGKIIHYKLCDLKTSWDKKVPIDTQKQVAENICKLQDCRKE